MAGIFARIAAGASVDAIFASDDKPPVSEKTFWRWLSVPEFDSAYLKACEQRGLKYAEEIAIIMDTPPRMTATAFGSKVDTGWVQLQKLRIDARQWIAARMQPKRYGDKVTLAGDPENPLIPTDESRATVLSRLDSLRVNGDATADVGRVTH